MPTFTSIKSTELSQRHSGRAKGPSIRAARSMTSLRKQFLLFVGVGAVATAAHYATLVAMAEFFRITPALASTGGLMVGVCLNYALNYRITFNSNSVHRKTLPRFLSISAFGLCINYVIMAAGTLWLNVHYLLIQVFSTALLLIFNFSANRAWVFRNLQHE